MFNDWTAEEMKVIRIRLFNRLMKSRKEIIEKRKERLNAIVVLLGFILILLVNWLIVIW